MNIEYFDWRNARAEAKPAQQARAALCRAEAQTYDPVLQVPHADAVSFVSFLRDVVAMFGGEDSGVDVGVMMTCDGTSIHVRGSLSGGLRRGLPRVRSRRDQPRRGWVSCDDARIIWHVGGYGTSYAIANLIELLDIVVERRLALEGGQA